MNNFCRLMVSSFVFFVAFSCVAKEYGNVEIHDIVAVYDGDTFRVNISQWPSIIGDNTSVRVKGVDTEEKRTQCAYEKNLVNKADLFIDGESLTKRLIKTGFGVAYDGGKRRRWC